MEVLHPEPFVASSSGIGSGMMNSSSSMGSGSTPMETTSTSNGAPSNPSPSNSPAASEISVTTGDANNKATSSSSAGMDVGNHDETAGTAPPPLEPSSSSTFKVFEAPAVGTTLQQENPQPPTSNPSTTTAASPPTVPTAATTSTTTTTTPPAVTPSPNLSVPSGATPEMMPSSVLSSMNYAPQSASSLLQPIVDSGSATSPSAFMSSPPTITPSNGTASLILSTNSASAMDGTNANQGALVRSNSFNEKGTKYIDLTDYLALPQTEAARRLGIPTSTLSKRWKEAVVNRKWPYRMVCKLNKEIMTLLHNVPQGPGAPPLPPEIEQSLGILLRRRQEELRGVVIRV